MALSTQPYKGARDFYPEDKRLQKYMFRKIRQVVETFGYEEYDAPILEPTDLYASKTSDEIVNEQTYTFTDRGGRSVTLRPEMTPTVSRMVAAKRQELAYPVRWYSIPNLWRYERPQRGRLREHWQLNVDIFGLDGVEGDHEIILVADAIMQGFKAKRDMYSIKINSRKLMDTIFYDYLKLDETQAQMMAQLIDRMHKIDYAEFAAGIDAIFQPHQRENGETELLLNILQIKNLNDLPGELRTHTSALELQVLLDLLAKSGVTNFEFDPTIMRGFLYYTDIVFEVTDTDPENNRSMYGGGRYDGLVAAFGVEPVPTVGFGMGDVTLQNFLESHQLLPKLDPETDVYVILIGDVYEPAQKALKEFRDNGVRLAIDMTGRKPDKQIKSAVKKGINYALFIGEKELSEGQFVLKNLLTGKDERHSIARTTSIIKDYRHRSASDAEDL
jgi:histidyl-tRNA synthetase